MTVVKRRWLLVAAVILIAGAGWFGVRQHRCNVRGIAFARQVETVKRDAAEELRVGVGKAEVTRFFTDHNIPFQMFESEAYGTLLTSGCAPLGCSTDRGFIHMQVKFDATGKVAEVPRLGGMYADCL